jgi:8-oxo-dGTP pyrophosphatase MutT (NUDIX family)
MVIAIDFDGTICEEKEYPDFGDFLPGAVEALKELARQGHNLILWTCRPGEEAQRIFKHCLNAGIPFKSVNQNLFNGELHNYKKILADIYIENRDVSFFRQGQVDWQYILDVITGTGDADVLFKGKFIKVISPKAAPYEAVQCGDAVMVFLMDMQNRITFIRREHCPPYEYQTPFKYYYTTITGGIEVGEVPLDAAIREVKEETGVDLKEHIVEVVDLFHGKFTKVQTDTIHVYLIKGSGFIVGHASGDGTFYEKECTTVQVPFDEIKDLRPRDYLLESLWALAKPYIREN